METEKKNWQRARELFHACLDLDAAERQALLDAEAQASPGLREEVLSLLAYHQDEETLIAVPDGLRQAGAADDRLERYELLEKVGQGGMGVVYRARRSDGVYEDEVAIKLLQRGLAGEELIERFERERQILANLKHPAIARLLDGGTASDGRPFLVMEFVDGTPIDRYCDQERLTLRQRVRLFTEVCRAVHFAHRSLVVHRDLKPANLLVSSRGEPKLLDFGVAKLIDPAAPDLTLGGSSEAGSPLTPDFASPEQVTGASITTGSDVYSLGVILYVLLCGEKPLQSRGLSLGEFVQAVCHQEPRPLTDHVTPREADDPDRQEALRLVATARSTQPEQLSRQLSGDLDRIVSMALHKESAQRYASAEDLARDLDRYLSGHPVQAREQTLTYRFGKFLSRNRWPTLAAATVALVLLSLALGLVRQRDRLLDEQAVNSEVTGFLEGLFENATPEKSLGRPVLASELLDRGAIDVRTRFAEQPEIKARLVAMMGRAYLKLGRLEEAEVQFNDSLAARNAVFGENHPERIDALFDMAELLEAQGSFAAAIETYESAKVPGKGRTERELRRQLGVAKVLRSQGQYEEAERLQRSALELAAELFNTEHPRYAEALVGLAELARTQGNTELARNSFEEARRALESAYGGVYPDVARLDMLIGLLLEAQGQYTEAEEKLRQALAAQTILFPDGHPEVADTLNNLASTVYGLGRLEEAEQLCLKGLSLRRRTLETDHPAIANSLNLLGLILHSRNTSRVSGQDFHDSEGAFQEARDLFLKALGPDHVQLAAVSSNHARALLLKGDYAQAEEQMHDALRIYRTAFGEDHAQVAMVLNNLAYSRRKQGDFAGASELYAESLKIHEVALGKDHFKTAATVNNLAVVLLEIGQPKRAEELFRRALDVFSPGLPANHVNLAIVRKTLAESLLAQGRLEDSEQLLLEALKIYRDGDKEGGLSWLRARGVLAEVWARQGKLEQARAALELDLAQARETYESETDFIDLTEKRLGDVLKSLG